MVHNPPGYRCGFGRWHKRNDECTCMTCVPVPREPTTAMIDAAHVVLSAPLYLHGDKRNTRDAIRAAIAAMSASQ